MAVADRAGSLRPYDGDQPQLTNHGVEGDALEVQLSPLVELMGRNEDLGVGDPR